MAGIRDLDTFGIVCGKLLSLQPEDAKACAEHEAFATATAECNAAGALLVDARANQDYMKTLLGARELRTMQRLGRLGTTWH